MPTKAELHAAAEAATEAWALEPTSVELISLSENAVFRVDSAEADPVVMRLHRPGYNSLPEMESELLWVESLRAAGIEAPAPRLKPDGAGYSPTAVGDETRLAGVIEWVDGMPMEAALALDSTTVAVRYRQLGELAARIHRHAEAWAPPDGFVRRRWDANGLVGPDPLWGRFWEVPTLTAEQRSLFELARQRLHADLSALPDDRSAFGLIHADLHLNNVMVDGERLIVIDFDDAGFGWYLHELGVALQPVIDEPWFDEARAAMVEGYRSIRPFSDEMLAKLPAFIAIRCLMLVSWLDARPELGLATEVLPRLIDEAVSVAGAYLQN